MGAVLAVPGAKRKAKSGRIVRFSRRGTGPDAGQREPRMRGMFITLETGRRGDDRQGAEHYPPLDAVD